MRNVAYFSNQFAAKDGHGIATYAHHLFEAMQGIENRENLIPVAAWSNRSEESFKKIQEHTGLRILPLGRKITPLMWTFLGFPKIETLLKGRVDIVHAVALGYPVATRRPFVVTVHDIGPLTHPEYFSGDPPWIMERSLKQAVKQASAMICVSHATASELRTYVLEKYGQDIQDRIHVVHEGVGAEYFDEPDMSCLDELDQLPQVGTPFILSAGKISPRKNFQGVIQALGMLKERVNHHLVAVGGDGWDFEQVKEQVEECGLTGRVHFVGYVSNEQLRALYRRASVYVHASLFEGFGLTNLEAMASGCPVVTSNCSSLPEVAGDAAILVDPKDVIDLSNGISSVLDNPEIAHRLRSAGLERSRKFTWEKAAKRVTQVYDLILNPEKS